MEQSTEAVQFKLQLCLRFTFPIGRVFKLPTHRGYKSSEMNIPEHVNTRQLNVNGSGTNPRTPNSGGTINIKLGQFPTLLTFLKRERDI